MEIILGCLNGLQIQSVLRTQRSEDRGRREDLLEEEAETEVMQPRGEEAGSHQKLEEGRTGSPLEHQKESVPANS